MKTPSNRMATPETRTPVPIERVAVQPPPEMIIKCPHCGTARIGQWLHAGSWPRTGEARKVCQGCGTKCVISLDYKTIRIVG
jgi:hypothetical protein